MLLSKDDALMCTDVLGNVYYKFCKFSCELLFVLLMQYIFRRIQKNDVMVALAYANVDSAMTDLNPQIKILRNFRHEILQIEYD